MSEAAERQSDPYRGAPVAQARAANGALCSLALLAQGEKLQRALLPAGEHIHVAIGHGMSNSVMIEAPDGLIIIDTGDSEQEAREHMAAFRTVSDKPVKAVIYSHSHYVFGTAAWLDRADGELEVWAHAKTDANVNEIAAEIGPAYRRRAMQMFGYFLPDDGDDAMPHYGLGIEFYHRDRRAKIGYLKPTRTVDAECEHRIAGLLVRFIPSPSDSDDTLIIQLPELDAVVNNHCWPALFNVYTLRGERYRDPLAYVAGIDRILEMDPEHLVGVHGPPVTPRANARQAARDQRDAVQFIWDQTVRGINDGLALEDIVARVRLPAHLNESPWIPQAYGELAYHVRGVYNGLFGWYEMDASRLHPLPPAEASSRTIDAMGGREAVVLRVRDALAAQDWSWAAELAAHLVRAEPNDDQGRQLKAQALRAIAQVTSAANTRSVCLTEALDLERRIDILAATPWRFGRLRVLGAEPSRFVRALRVRLDPDRAASVRASVSFTFTDVGARCGYEIDRGIARFQEPGPVEGDVSLTLDLPAWADWVDGHISLTEAVAAGRIQVGPSLAEAIAVLGVFDRLAL
ncbi:MAG: alkyl sulfatase dimerization domain-containing protein [Burkholderiaceae bacterium]